MKLITNISDNNHRHRLVELISTADKIVLCSGWINPKGLETILTPLKSALKRGADIRIYTNKKHTPQKCINTLSRAGIDHKVVDNEVKYLHSKIFYFTEGQSYTALIGSANLTYGGLVDNEELSVETTGLIPSVEHQRLYEHIKFLESYMI